jgi:hypothetical protein
VFRHPYFLGLPDPHPDPQVRSGSAFGSVPKCHGSPTLLMRLLISCFKTVKTAVPSIVSNPSGGGYEQYPAPGHLQRSRFDPRQLICLPGQSSGRRQPRRSLHTQHENYFRGSCVLRIKRHKERKPLGHRYLALTVPQKFMAVNKAIMLSIRQRVREWVLVYF